MKFESLDRPENCPKCASENIIRIVYGYPTHELREDSEAGRVALGGCCQCVDDPLWECGDCKTELYKKNYEL
jgi:hypothetical protein